MCINHHAGVVTDIQKRSTQRHVPEHPAVLQATDDPGGDQHRRHQRPPRPALLHPDCPPQDVGCEWLFLLSPSVVCVDWLGIQCK